MSCIVRAVDINGVRDPRELSADEVWVVDSRARRGDPASFDASAATMSPAGRSLRPSLVAMPGRIDELERRLAAHRVKGAPDVLRICPGPEGHGFPLEPWAVSPIPEYCEREEVALAIDFGAPAPAYPWAEMVRFARDYPRLPMVALGAPLGGPVPARALDASPNLILETSAVADDGGAQKLAGLVRSHGAYRFAYGSGIAGGAPAILAEVLDAPQAGIVLSETAGQLATGKWAATHL